MTCLARPMRAAVRPRRCVHEQPQRFRGVRRRAQLTEERAVSEFLNYLINGTLSGLLYALIAMGFVVSGVRVSVSPGTAEGA